MLNCRNVLPPNKRVFVPSKAITAGFEKQHCHRGASLQIASHEILVQANVSKGWGSNSCFALRADSWSRSRWRSPVATLSPLLWIKHLWLNVMGMSAALLLTAKVSSGLPFLSVEGHVSHGPS